MQAYLAHLKAEAEASLLRRCKADPTDALGIAHLNGRRDVLDELTHKDLLIHMANWLDEQERKRHE